MIVKFSWSKVQLNLILFYSAHFIMAKQIYVNFRLD